MQCRLPRAMPGIDRKFDMSKSPVVGIAGLNPIPKRGYLSTERFLLQSDEFVRIDHALLLFLRCQFFCLFFLQLRRILVIVQRESWPVEGCGSGRATLALQLDGQTEFVR